MHIRCIYWPLGSQGFKSPCIHIHGLYMHNLSSSQVHMYTVCMFVAFIYIIYLFVYLSFFHAAYKQVHAYCISIVVVWHIY